MKKLFFWFLIFNVLFFLGCRHFEWQVKKRAEELKWNKDEAEVAFVMANRHLMAEESKEKKGLFKINSRRIGVEDVLKKVTEIVESLDFALNTADEGWRNYLEANNLREEFLREREKYKIVRDRLRLIYLNGRFYELLGLSRSYYDDRDFSSGLSSSAPYSLKYLLSDEELLKYDFVAKMDELKAKGKYREFQKVLYFISDELAQKIPDPNYPGDPNRFLWQKIRRGLEVKTYYASGGKSLVNEGEYIEATRVEIIALDGAEIIKRESKPVLRIFSSGYRKLNVAVADADFEGSRGFGMPDEIFEISGIKNGDEVFKKSGIIDFLFAEREKKEKSFYFKKEQIIEIVRAGEDLVEEWEIVNEANGWQVGFRYKDQFGENYKVKVVYKKMEFPVDHANAHSVKREIEAIAKEYYIPGNSDNPSAGAVTEYYRPKEPYNKKDVLEVETKDKKITIYRESEPAVNGVIQNQNNLFIEDRPFRIDFTEGDQRWRIEDRTQNDGILESRKKI